MLGKKMFTVAEGFSQCYLVLMKDDSSIFIRQILILFTVMAHYK